jgi:hypothetical protein
MNPVAGPDRSEEEAEAAVHRTAASLDLGGPLSPPAPEDRWRAGGLARMVCRICGRRETPADTALSPWTGGGTVPTDAAALHVGCHARTAGHTSVAPLSLQDATTGHG